jgi:phenylacetyl-CoA:acceptor oxidoreductase subunit 2
VKSSVGNIAPWQQTNWDWRAAGNFIGGGSGTGVLVCAPFVDGRAAPLLTLLGLALVGAGLLCVWLEIGQPWRALNVYFAPSTSWMTREAMIAPLLFAGGGWYAWRGGAALPWLVAVLALAYVYCQARMLQAGRGIPAWRHPRTVGLLPATALAEGSGLALTALAAFDAVPIPAFLPWLVALAVIARALVLIAYLRGLAGRAPVAALIVLDQYLTVDRLLTIIAVAAILAAAALGGGRWLLIVAGLAALAAGWLLKFTIVVRAAYNQGFALPLLPVRGPGHAAAGVKPGW